MLSFYRIMCVPKLMNNQKTIFTIIAIVAALSFAAVAPAMTNIAMADDPFDGKGNPHDEPNFQDGNPHEGNQQGKPQRCPGNTCSD
jgi:hypothetical protein